MAWSVAACVASCGDAVSPPITSAPEMPSPWRLPGRKPTSPADLPSLSAQQSGVELGPEFITSGPDDSCVSCHEAVTQAYRTSGMQHSLTLPEGNGSIEAGLAGLTVEVNETGARYEFLARAGRYFIRTSFTDSSGRERAGHESPVDLVVGSGRLKRSYFQVRDGRFLELPLTWYRRRLELDLSPGGGFGEITRRLGVPLCVACHTGSVTRRPGGVESGYQGQIALGISCGRCHGDDATHGATGDLTTTVSPARLSLERQSEVCHQCHLSGALSLLHEDADITRYRPGTPLGAVLGVFDGALDDDSPDGRSSISGHADRLRRSKCFTARPDLTCTTCHNPHVAHRTDESTRGTERGCAACHDDDACTQPLAERGAHSCSSCHMGRRQSSDIEHTRITDHLIKRRPPVDTRDARDPARRGRPHRLALLALADAPLVNRLDPQDALPGARLLKATAYLTGADAALDLGERPHAYARRAALLAQSMLAERPDDDAAQETLGRALVFSGDLAQGAKVLEEALKTRPDSGPALTALAWCETQRGATERGIELMRRAYAVAPYSENLPRMLAFALSSGGRHKEALDVLDTARERLGPALSNAEQALGAARALRDEKRALAACYDLLLLRPRSPDVLALAAEFARLAGHDVSESRTLFNDALAVDGANVRTLLGLAELEYAAGEKELALALLARARVAAPNDPGVRETLGRLR